MNQKPTYQPCVCGLHPRAAENLVFLTLDDLSSRWKVSTNWVYKNHKRIGLPAIKPGGQKLRFPLDCLVAWEARVQSMTVIERSPHGQ